MSKLIKNHFRKALGQLIVWPRFKSPLLYQTKAYRRDLERFQAQGKKHSMEIPFGNPFPCLTERNNNSGTASGHYFHQDLLVARRVFAAAPIRHIDVGSRIDGFVAHVASFREIEVIDVRPLDDPIPNVSFLQADLMSEIDVSYEECCDSVSCLHALEHFGLGRYGDPVEYDGHISGLLNLHRILKVGGTLYLSVPIGPLRVEFNAHRVFIIKYLLKLFEGLFAVKSFSYVGDDQILYEDVELDYKNAPNNFNCTYGCGIFELKKLQVV